MLLYCLMKIFILSLASNGISGSESCNPKSFRVIDGPAAPGEELIVRLRVINNEEIECAKNVSYMWETFTSENGSLIPIPDAAISAPHVTKSIFISMDLRNVTLHDPNLDKSYIIRCTLIPNAPHLPSFRQLNIFLKPTLVIKGESVRIHTLGSGSLWLNATVKWRKNRTVEIKEAFWSCNPVLKDSITSQKMKWQVFEMYLIPKRNVTCKVSISLTDGRLLTGSQDIDIKPMKKYPAMEVICIENCEYGNATKRSILQYICYANCDAPPVWTVYPYDEDLHDKLQPLNEPENSVLIPGGTFLPGSDNKILVSLGSVTANYTVVYFMDTTNTNFVRVSD